MDVRFTGTLAFAGGMLGSFDCGLDMVARSELELIGDAGSLFVADPWHSRAAGIELRRPDGVEKFAVAAADPYACELEDFAAAVHGERPHPFGRADAVGAGAHDRGALPRRRTRAPTRRLETIPASPVSCCSAMASRWRWSSGRMTSTSAPQTGWFLVPLDDDGEPAHERRRRLAVSPDVERLVADTELSRAAWLAQAETVELVTAAAAVAAAGRLVGGTER